MTMLNNDVINQESKKFMQKMMEALQNDNADQAAAALQEMQNSICWHVQR